MRSRAPRCRSLRRVPLPCRRRRSIPPPRHRHRSRAGAADGAHRRRAEDLAEELQPQRYVVGWLVGLNGTARGESFPVRMGRNVLGRDRRSDIVVNDDQASSHHADLVFRPEERRFILMDHNSTNGTYVNESEIEPRRDLGDRRHRAHRLAQIPLRAALHRRFDVGCHG